MLSNSTKRLVRFGDGVQELFTVLWGKYKWRFSVNFLKKNSIQFQNNGTNTLTGFVGYVGWLAGLDGM